MDTLEKKSVLERIDCATEQIENVVMSLGLLTISGIVFANVIARYFFRPHLHGLRSWPGTWWSG